MSNETRAAPLYCPYCGEEDLRPSEEGHGAWECHACARVFSVKFLGLLGSAVSRSAADRSPAIANDWRSR
jgi:transposase-like protein